MSQRTPSRQRITTEKHNHKNPFLNLNLENILAMDQPYIDINMPSTERRLAAFKLQLGKYTAANAEEVTKRRNVHVKEVDRLRAEKAQIEVDIQTYRLKEIALSKGTPVSAIIRRLMGIIFLSELEEERQERKHVEELVAHNNRQLKTLQERLHEKEEEYKKLDIALERLRKCPFF